MYAKHTQPGWSGSTGGLHGEIGGNLETGGGVYGPSVGGAEVQALMESDLHYKKLHDHGKMKMLAFALATGFLLVGWVYMNEPLPNKRQHMKERELGKAGDSSKQKLPNQGFCEHRMRSLENGTGEEAFFFRGCVDFVGKLEADFLSSLPSLVTKCKKGQFDKIPHFKIPESRKLNATCDRMSHEIKVQDQYKDGMFSTPQCACATIVDLVLPITEEPECMTYMEDISHVHAQKKGYRAQKWPGIIYTEGFNDSFSTECQQEVMLQSETGGATFPVPSPCPGQLESLHQVGRAKRKTAADLLEAICSALGLSLESSNAETRKLAWTTRSAVVQGFYEAALKQRARAKHSTETGRKEMSARRDKVSARRLLEDTLSAKEGNHRRLGGSMSGEEQVICDKKAYTHEGGASIQIIMGVGGSLGHAYGYHRSYGNDGIYKSFPIKTWCGKGDLDAGAGVSYARGYFYDVDDIPGKSAFWAWTLGLVVDVGWAKIKTPSGKEIGEVWELGVGVDSPVEIVTNLLNTNENNHYCHTTKMNEGYSKTYPNLLSKCAAANEGSCFPADAQVMTQSGSKPMNLLKVGDKVLVVEKHGKLVFDDVYFFGHAEFHTTTEYVQLILSSKTREGSPENNEVVLEMSEEHFVPVCPADVMSCTWKHRTYSYARDITAGCRVWVVNNIEGDYVDIYTVSAAAKVNKMGKYNPYTLSGNIVVNNAVMSSHSSWIFDSWVPREWISRVPDMYQALFFPGRLAYMVFGPKVADLFDMNNPQSSPETFGYGLQFLEISFLVLCALVTASIQIARRRIKHPS